MSHVKKMVSGPPASICIAPANAARKIFLTAVAPRAFGGEHDPRHPTERGDVARPHEQVEREAVEGENRTPANAAAKLFPVQRRARKYMPSPANHKCSRQKKLNDHVSGSSQINSAGG
jgi:hypothetical protein